MCSKLCKLLTACTQQVMPETLELSNWEGGAVQSCMHKYVLVNLLSCPEHRYTLQVKRLHGTALLCAYIYLAALCRSLAGANVHPSFAGSVICGCQSQGGSP